MGGVELAYQNKKSFCFFEQLLSNFRYKKQILMVFLAPFAQIFREITGNVLENPEQLAESPTSGAI